MRCLPLTLSPKNPSHAFHCMALASTDVHTRCTCSLPYLVIACPGLYWCPGSVCSCDIPVGLCRLASEVLTRPGATEPRVGTASDQVKLPNNIKRALSKAPGCCHDAPSSAPLRTSTGALLEAMHKLERASSVHSPRHRATTPPATSSPNHSRSSLR